MVGLGRFPEKAPIDQGQPLFSTYGYGIIAKIRRMGDEALGYEFGGVS